MKVHLIRTKDVSRELFADVTEFLAGYPGPVSFHAGEPLSEYGEDELKLEHLTKDKFYHKEQIMFALDCDSFPLQRRETTWATIFRKCKEYRKTANVPDGDVVILLTETANAPNWFSAMEQGDRLNGFVHTADWQYYLHSSPVFSVTYLIAAMIVKLPAYKSAELLNSVMHKEPKGCISDFCQDKSQVRLKLRTADICGECMSVFSAHHQPLVIRQMISILEAVRTRMLYHQNFRQDERPGKLLITRHHKIILPDYGNIPVKLTPLERTLYICYLRHPEGIRLTDLCDHRAELLSIYGMISSKGLLADIQNSINSMVDVTTNSASEKIAKIKAAFVNGIGEGLAEHYIIKGANSQAKRIHLEQGLVEWEGTTLPWPSLSP